MCKNEYVEVIEVGRMLHLNKLICGFSVHVHVFIISMKYLAALMSTLIIQSSLDQLRGLSPDIDMLAQHKIAAEKGTKNLDLLIGCCTS